ncbi:MAG: hypothetical protein WBL72_21845, partial [Thermoguttaceae bacterium]
GSWYFHPCQPVPACGPGEPTARFDSGAGIGTWAMPWRARTPSDDLGAIQGDLIAGRLAHARIPGVFSSADAVR